MPRLRWMFALLLVWTNTAAAIELHWSSGASDLTFTSAVRCTLVIAADTGDVLPSAWQLAWAGTEPVSFVSVDSSSACGQSYAHSEHFDGPETAVDTLSQMYRGYFCSNDPTQTPSARVIMDLPADSRGKFKVVALDGSDFVLQSGLATYNGGLSAAFPPVLLTTTRVHEGLQLTVDVVGTDLAPVSSVTVSATDKLWTIPLQITAKTDTSLSAQADVPSLLPASVLLATTSIGLAGEANLEADAQTMATVAASVTADTILFADPNPKVFPKDFAFYYNSVPNPTDNHRKGVFHLFYIRQFAPTSADSIIAHAWCDTLGAPWMVDTLAFRPSNLTWDKMKVWAPSLQQVGNRTYMFYTGLDSLGNQSIGYASTDSLFTTNIPWHRNKAAVYTAANTDWADAVGHEISGRTSFRDPFVMPDPEHAGRYLLFNVGEDKNLFPKYAVGVARNVAGTFNSWSNIGKYAATDPVGLRALGLTIPGPIESPLVVKDSLSGAWRMFIANANYDTLGQKSTYFLTETAGDSIGHLAAASWPHLDSLFFYMGNDQNLIGWEACEHLQIGDVHFFAAYNGNGIGITRMHWDPSSQKFFFVHPTNVGVGPPPPMVTGLRFYIEGLRPGAGEIRLVVESATAIAPRISIYDVSGRKVQQMGSAKALRGRREFIWNCRSGSGQVAATGMYFARLECLAGSMSLRIPLIR